MPCHPARSATLPRCAVNSKIFSCHLRSQLYSSYIFPSVTSPLLGTSRRHFAGRVVEFSCPRTFPRPSLSRRSFSSTSTVMGATKIDGTAIAKSIREGLKAEIAKIQESNPRFKPSLVIFQGTFSQTSSTRLGGGTDIASILVGNRSDSSEFYDLRRLYIRCVLICFKAHMCA
jgi:methylenetetrahydrofolate dehydrogenase (NADP+)/methenyltetrahydrofolate cyclohydrolase/formyltetrahydrofolate synthetase